MYKLTMDIFLNLKRNVNNLCSQCDFFYSNWFWRVQPEGYCCIWITQKTRFVSLKIDNCGDAIMSSEAIYYHTPYSILKKMSSLYIIIRIHFCISTIINFQTTKFGDKLLHDPIPQWIYFNPFSHQTARWHDHYFTNDCICVM